jgi:hemerythrin
MSLLAFNEKIHVLNLESMDATHKEFIDLYNSTDIESFEDIKNKLMLIIEHSKNHFAKEEELMSTNGYPRIREHKDEHAKAIAEMNYFLGLSNNRFGLGMMKSYFLHKIPEWFNLHLMNMDSDLSSFIKSKQL